MVRKRGVARTSFARRRVRRVQKYDSHVTPLRYKKYLPRMAELLKPPLDIHVECEVPCMELLDTLGVPTDEWQYYLGFMKRMIVLYRKFTSETLASEKESLISEYVLRGKDESVLEEVQEVAALCAGGIFEMDLWTRDFYMVTQFQHTDGFFPSTVGTGNWSIAIGILSISTGVNIGSIMEVTPACDPITIPSTWDKDRRLRTTVTLVTDTNQVGYIVVGGLPTALERAIGFKIVNNQIFGCVCDGVAETLTAALLNFVAGEIHSLEARYVAGTECRFYIDGAEVGVITTGLPSGTVGSEIFFHVYIENTAAEDKSLEFILWEFYQKR